MQRSNRTTSDIASKKTKEVIFEINVPGKWILAGEHSVLRGYEALVFPLQAKFLKLTYSKNLLELASESESEFELLIEGQNKHELELIIWSVLEKAFNKLNIKRRQILGSLRIQSEIVLGGGMGASATLCVALTEWFCFLNYIKTEDRFDFARELENLFHGESSGVDVAVTLLKKPLVFTRHHGFTELTLTSSPSLYLSYSGERGVTKDCIEKVKALHESQPERAQKIDDEMQETVLLLKKLLQQQSSKDDWIQAIKKSNDCFEQWGLITDQVRNHQKVLTDAGALAVKLTGSGGGGYVLSLWDGKPSPDLPFELIACF